MTNDEDQINATFSSDDLYKCAKREIALRRRIYPRLIAQDKISQETADRELELMGAIADHFKSLAQPKLL